MVSHKLQLVMRWPRVSGRCVNHFVHINHVMDYNLFACACAMPLYQIRHNILYIDEYVAHEMKMLVYVAMCQIIYIFNNYWAQYPCQFIRTRQIDIKCARKLQIHFRPQKLYNTILLVFFIPVMPCYNCSFYLLPLNFFLSIPPNSSNCVVLS